MSGAEHAVPVPSLRGPLSLRRPPPTAKPASDFVTLHGRAYNRAMRIPALLCGLAACLVDGCGGASGGGSTAAATFPARFARDWCAMMNRCCAASGGTAVPSCEATVAAEWTSNANQAIADGATFDDSTAARCLDLIRAADCASTETMALVELSRTCDESYHGAIPPGGACHASLSCAAPMVDGGVSGAASCVNSACVQVTWQAPGAACNGATLACDPRGTCVNGICLVLPADGEECAGSCRPGAYCSGGLCRRFGGLGDTCAVSSDCVSNRCSGNKCASLFASEDACTLP